MRIWHISDTHSYEHLLTPPVGIDMVIHSGDISNYYSVFKNEPEAMNFLYWYSKLDIQYKILIGGNHDALIFKSRTKFKAECTRNNIIYLENESVSIGGLNIWGSPYTPTFGNWYFMKPRHKIGRIWDNIPDNTDIIVTHGPPKGILDLSYSINRELEYCGCKALKTKVLKLEPKLHLFGHIHNCKDIINAGTRKLSNYETIFSNGSVVTDNKFGQLSSNGQILEI